MTYPFSDNKLQAIFKTNANSPSILSSRENKSLEFKESFSVDVLNNCLRTVAAFANSDGGYIVFGIKDSPHELRGLDKKNEERFDFIDPAKITEILNNSFDPEIRVDFYKYKFEGKSFGLLYAYPVLHKPVICKKNGVALRESAIYYRYRGLTREIRFSELRSIISEEIAKENEKWMKVLRQLGESGVANTAVLNLQSGKVSGTGSTLVVDETLLKQIKFVHEGSFVETGGDPALKLIGEIQTVVGGKTIVMAGTQPRSITIDDILTSFIKQEKVQSPKEFIRQICYQTSGNIPVYYFIDLAELSISEAIDFIDEIPKDSQAKSLLRRRLANQERLHIPITNPTTPIGRKKNDYRSAILSRKLTVPTISKELKYCLSAIQMLSKDEIEKTKDYLFDRLFQIYTNYFNSKEFSDILTSFRYAICWVDEALYMPETS